MKAKTIKNFCINAGIIILALFITILSTFILHKGFKCDKQTIVSVSTPLGLLYGVAAGLWISKRQGFFDL